MNFTRFRRSAVLAAMLGLCAGSTWVAAQSAIFKSASDPSSGSDPRIIRDCMGIPSEIHPVSFEGNSEGSAVIKEVPVKPGDVVKVGDVLMVEDTAQAEAELAIYDAQAKGVGAIQEAQSTIDDKTLLLKRYQGLPKANQQDIELLQTQLDIDIASARLQQAKDEQKQHQLAADRQALKIKHMTLLSPVDGIVESVNLHTGQIVDSGSSKDGACFIVSNNPLWVELHLDSARAAKLKLGDAVEVAFPDKADEWIGGKVIFLDPMVDFVGQTQTVRVAIANPDNRPSGLPMIVRLPAKVVGDVSAVGSAQP